MACVMKYRGKWNLDYRDPLGRRRRVQYETRRRAEEALAEVIRAAGQANGRPTVDPDVTLSDYSDRWLKIVGATSRGRTLETYTRVMNLHVLPTLGRFKVRGLGRAAVKALLVEQLAGHERATVRLTLAVLRGCLNAAIDDGVIGSNPAARLGRTLKLATPSAAPTDDGDEVKAMTRPQVATFLATAAKAVPRYWALFLLLARTGLRIGEALVLKWDDIDWTARTLRVVRGLSAGKIGAPKSGKSRTVDLSAGLVAALRRLQVERKMETLRRGWSEVPPWVFLTPVGTIHDPSRTVKAFKRVLKVAELPGHFSPHSFRHTYASLLLADGVSIAYVQRQLGHASISLTVDLYGKWLPMNGGGAVDRLDEVADGPDANSSGIKVVSKPEVALVNS